MSVLKTQKQIILQHEKTFLLFLALHVCVTRGLRDNQHSFKNSIHPEQFIKHRPLTGYQRDCTCHRPTTQPRLDSYRAAQLIGSGSKINELFKLKMLLAKVPETVRSHFVRHGKRTLGCDEFSARRKKNKKETDRVRYKKPFIAHSVCTV